MPPRCPPPTTTPAPRRAGLGGSARLPGDRCRLPAAQSEPPHLGAGGQPDGGPQPPHHEHHRLQQAQRPGAFRGGRQGAGAERPALRGGGGGAAPRRGAAPRQPVHQGEPQPAQPADGVCRALVSAPRTGSAGRPRRVAGLGLRDGFLDGSSPRSRVRVLWDSHSTATVGNSGNR